MCFSIKADPSPQAQFSVYSPASDLDAAVWLLCWCISVVVMLFSRCRYLWLLVIIMSSSAPCVVILCQASFLHVCLLNVFISYLVFSMGDNYSILTATPAPLLCTYNTAMLPFQSWQKGKEGELRSTKIPDREGDPTLCTFCLTCPGLLFKISSVSRSSWVHAAENPQNHKLLLCLCLENHILLLICCVLQRQH